MPIVTVGIDLAKKVFAVHGVDESGKPAPLRPEVSRAKLLELIVNLPLYPSGMEAAPESTTGPGSLPSSATRCA